jgi:HK97 family phage portal protein
MSFRRRRIARARAELVDPAGRPLNETKLERTIREAIEARAGGVSLTPWELPIVVACRQLIADTVGQLPMIAYRGNVPRPDQPAIVIRPDPFEPRWQTLHRLVNNLTGWGHAWLIPTAAYANDYPAAVRVVDASRAHGVFDPSGRLVDVYHDGRRLQPGTEAILVPWRVTQAGTAGHAPMNDCFRAAEYLAALYDMAGSFWEAGFPSIAVLVKQALNPTQTAELKSQVLSAWARRHEPAVIDRDGQLAPVGTNAVEAQLVESIAVANTEIARAFGVMPSLVNVAAGDSLTYATTEAEFAKWLKVGLGAYLMRIEAAFSDLTPHGTEVRFDTTELLRTDLAARYQAYALGVQYGWILPAEVRQREGLPPLPTSSAPAPAPTILSDPPQSVPLPNPTGAAA